MEIPKRKTKNVKKWDKKNRRSSIFNIIDENWEKIDIKINKWFGLINKNWLLIWLIITRISKRNYVINKTYRTKTNGNWSRRVSIQRSVFKPSLLNMFNSEIFKKLNWFNF